MRRFAYSITGLLLAATAAHAQPAAEVTGAIQGDAATQVQGPEAAVSNLPADPELAPDAALPADPAVDAAADVAADAAAETALDAATASGPAWPAAPVAAISDTEIDSFAQATVKLQAIQADASIAPEQKQSAMAAVVTEVGLDPAKYNEIGAKVSEDAALRARVQTAMARHAEHSDG